MLIGSPMSVGAAGPLVVTYPLSERSRAIVERWRATLAGIVTWSGLTIVLALVFWH